MLHVQRLPAPASLASLAPEWETLAGSISPWLPFRSALWNDLWWTHFHRHDRFQTDEFFVHAVRDGAGRLIAVAPLMLTHVGVAGLPRLRVLQFFGNDPFMTEIRGVVCRPEDHRTVFDALQHALRKYRTAYDWCRWTGVRRDAIAADAGPVRWGADLPNYYLDLPDTWELFKAGRSRNIKESLRKCYNSLKRDGHAFGFHVRSQPAEMDAALTRFFELHAARAQVRHSNVFASPQARAFLREYTARTAEQDQVRIFQLEIRGEVVATRIGFVHGGELYLYYSGYDPAWSRYSVMTTVTAEAIQWAISHRFRIVNLSAGRDVSKTRWGPNETVFADGIQVSNTWRAMCAFRAHSLLGADRATSPIRRLIGAARAGQRP